MALPDLITTTTVRTPHGIINKFCAAVAAYKDNLHNLSVLVAVNFVTAGVGFLTTVKIANTLGKETFGLLAYGLAIAGYCRALIYFGLDRTLVRDLIHHPSRFANLVATSLVLRWGMLGIVIGLLIMWKLVAGAEGDLSWGLILVVIANSLISLDLRPVYDTWHKMSRHAIYNLIQRGLYFLTIWGIILIAPQNLNIFWIGAVTLASVVLYLVLQHSWAISRIDMSTASVGLLSGTAKMAACNVTMFLAAIGHLSFGSFGQIILKNYCGTAELGGYGAAWQIAAIADMFLIQIGRIGNPTTAKITRPDVTGKDRLRFIIKYSCVMFAAALPIALAAFIFPGWILRILFKPEYASAASALRVMSVYVLILSIGVIAWQYVISAGMESLYFSSTIIGGILSIGLCFLLIPRLGATGAAFALLVAHGTTMGMYWIVMLRHIRKLS